MPSAVSGRQWPAESPAKKTSSVDGARAACAGSSCPGSGPRPGAAAPRGRPSAPSRGSAGRTSRRPTRISSCGGEAPAVAGRHDRAVDPDLELAARSAGMHLEPARERGVGRLVSARASTRRHPSASTTSGADTSPRSVLTLTSAVRRPRAPLDLGRLELGVVLLVEQLAERRGSRRSRRSMAAGSARSCAGVCRPAARTSGGSSPRARAPRARRWARRRPRSGARRSRSGPASAPRGARPSSPRRGAGPQSSPRRRSRRSRRCSAVRSRASLGAPPRHRGMRLPTATGPTWPAEVDRYSSAACRR